MERTCGKGNSRTTKSSFICQPQVNILIKYYFFLFAAKRKQKHQRLHCHNRPTSGNHNQNRKKKEKKNQRHIKSILTQPNPTPNFKPTPDPGVANPRGRRERESNGPLCTLISGTISHGFQPTILHRSFVWSDVGLLDLIQFGFWCGFVDLSFLGCALEPVVVDFWWASELVVAAWERGQSKHKRERKLANETTREGDRQWPKIFKKN